MDTTVLSNEYDIMGTPCGFLIGKGWGSQYHEVQIHENGYNCDCNSNLSTMGEDCEHITAIKAESLSVSKVPEGNALVMNDIGNPQLTTIKIPVL